MVTSHQLSNGLYVSGMPEQPKEKPPVMSSAAVPYTGGDVRKSGELGKMFDIDGKSRKSGPLPSRAGSFTGSGSNSGPIPGGKSNSGPQTRSDSTTTKKLSGPQSRPNSGPLLPVTGLITSGPISGPLSTSSAPKKVSGPLDSVKNQYQNPAVTVLSKENKPSFSGSFPKLVFWVLVLLFAMGFMAGGFIFAAVHNAILLIVVTALFCGVLGLFVWNTWFSVRATIGFVTRHPDAELRTAKNGEFVKISGVVTCGNVPLESSFQKIPRCVFTSTRLYEYRGWNSLPANPTHRRFTWGLRHLETRGVDFYISDFQSGLRALVKTGYGAKVVPFVDDALTVEVNPCTDELSSEFLRWLTERNLSCEDRLMKLKEGYIKEGSAVSVMGVVQRNENLLMIVPPPEPTSTGCLWTKCLFPANLDGVVLRCEDSSKHDVIPV